MIAAVILKNCLQAMKTTSLNDYKLKNNIRLLVIDTIMPESNEPFVGKFTDILMLALTRNGRIRTEKEFRNLLYHSGFDTVNVIRSPDPENFLSVIEAIPSHIIHLINTQPLCIDGSLLNNFSLKYQCRKCADVTYNALKGTDRNT